MSACKTNYVHMHARKEYAPTAAQTENKAIKEELPID